MNYYWFDYIQTDEEIIDVTLNVLPYIGFDIIAFC